MILVVGATGLLGTEICTRLRARGQSVRALVRGTSRSKAEPLRQLGVELCEGDLRERADVERACAGISAVISTATAMGATDRRLKLCDIDGKGQITLIDAARRAGVERFVFVSASPNLQPTAPLIRYKRAAEAALRGSGMTWTILQPSVFMEVWLGSTLGWDVARRKAAIFGPGTAPLPWISVHDVAEYAVRALDDPRVENRDVPLGGPEAQPPNEVVRMFERAVGAPFRVKRVPRPVLTLLGPVVALLNEAAASGMSLGAQTALGDPIDSPLQRELAITLTPVSEYVARTVSG